MRIVESLANPFTLSTLPRSGSTWNVILHEVELGVVHKWRHIILYTFWTPGSVVNFFITKALTLSSQTRSLTPPETWRQLWMTLSNTIPQFPELESQTTIQMVHMGQSFYSSHQKIKHGLTIISTSQIKNLMRGKIVDYLECKNKLPSMKKVDSL